MKKQIVQFHATPKELVDFSNAIKKEFDIDLVLNIHNPFSVEQKFNLSVADIPFDGCTIYFSEKEINSGL